MRLARRSAISRGRILAFRNILVTGSSGGIGKVVVRELLAHDYHVTGADLHRAHENPIRTYITDFEDLGQTFGVVEGHDAIIHLAAIPSPMAHTPEVVFRTNLMSTFNILQAATVLGIQKVVLISSLSALGTAFHFRHFDPLYLPLDEAHPLLSQDAYGLSKQLGEDLAEGFIRRTPGMSISSMRFTSVFLESYHEHHQGLPQSYDHYRALWTYIDVRDAARSCRLAMEYTTPGHEAYYITAPETYLDVPTLDVIKKYYPSVERIAAGFGGHMAPVDCSKAERQLGFKPHYYWDGRPREGV